MPFRVSAQATKPSWCERCRAATASLTAGRRDRLAPRPRLRRTLAALRLLLGNNHKVPEQTEMAINPGRVYLVIRHLAAVAPVEISSPSFNAVSACSQVVLRTGN